MWRKFIEFLKRVGKRKSKFKKTLVLPDKEKAEKFTPNKPLVKSIEVHEDEDYAAVEINTNDGKT